MSLTIRPTRLTIAVAVLLALGIGGLIYAAVQVTHQRTTGTFSVNTEGPSMLVTTYDAATGTVDASWASCSAPTLTDGQQVHCLVRMANTRVQNKEVRYSLNLSPNGDVALAQALNVTMMASPSVMGCNSGLAATALASGVLSTPGGIGFGDPAGGQQTGDRLVPAGGSDDICIRLTYAAGTTPPFGSSLSGLLTVVADDTGLE